MAALGASYRGWVALQTLLGSCRALWARRADIEGAVMGAQPWAAGRKGREAAWRRWGWAHVPAVPYRIGPCDRSWYTAYAFAAGAHGYAVFEQQASRSGVWFRPTGGGPESVVWHEVMDCNHGHELLLGPRDSREGCPVGQWVAVTFELRTGGQAITLFDGRLKPVFAMVIDPGSAPLRMCSGSFGGEDFVCVYSQCACVLLRLEVRAGTCGVTQRRFAIHGTPQGGIFLGGAVYLVTEGAVWALSLGADEFRCVCRRRRFTGAVCALELEPGRHGLALMTRDEGVVWWDEQAPLVVRVLRPVVWGVGEECSLAALDARRFAVVGRGGHVWVVCAASGVLEDDFQAVWQPPRQIRVMADPDGRVCVAALKMDCTLAVLGAPELCRL